jgi:acyl-CoA thioesterase-1
LAVDGKLPELSQAQSFFQPDGVHPNKEGVARIVMAMGPKVLDLIEDIKAQ